MNELRLVFQFLCIKHTKQGEFAQDHHLNEPGRSLVSTINDSGGLLNETYFLIHIGIVECREVF